MEGVVIVGIDKKGKFMVFAKASYIISFIMLIFLILSSIVSACIICLIGFNSQQALNKFLRTSDIHIGMDIYGANLEVSPEVIQHTIFSKQSVLLLFIALLILNIVLLFITFFLKSIFKSLKTNNIFTLKNSQYISYIGYSFILLSLIYQPIKTIIFFIFDQTFGFSKIVESGGFISDMSYHYIEIHWTLLFSGVIICIVAKIFKHGAFLQKEYDSTI